MKTAYEIRQIDAMNDGFWYWNESWHIGEFETASDNTKRPFMKALKKLGIIFKKAPSHNIKMVKKPKKGAFKMNKKQQGIYEQYLKSTNCNLYDCYKRPSEAKLEAERGIICACRHDGGKRFRILSYNTFSFTCAYCVEKDGKTNLVWHSPYHCDVFQIPESPTQFT